MSGELSFHVAGLPATFATAGEKPWKARLSAGIPAPSVAGQEVGLTARFILPTMAPAGNPLDIDNLCEPLFSVLVNRLRWFGGARPNIKWWSASKEVGATHGCHVTISGAPAPPSWDRPPVLSGVYAGIMPRSARDSAPAEWCQGLVRGGVRIPRDVALSCSLAFGSSGINLGDVATGVIKSLIDCLYPLWGGVAGSPADHRIDVLTVAKAVAGVPSDAVSVAVWYLARRVAPDGLHRTTPLPRSPRKENDVMPQRPEEAVSNPCRPGTAKHVVCEAAIAGWSLERISRELDALKPGSSRRLSEYISDLRSENGLDVGHDGRNMWCRGRIAGR